MHNKPEIGQMWQFFGMTTSVPRVDGETKIKLRHGDIVFITEIEHTHLRDKPGSNEGYKIVDGEIVKCTFTPEEFQSMTLPNEDVPLRKMFFIHNECHCCEYYTLRDWNFVFTKIS